jgi:mannose-1-phosphate guanylyltransferase
MIEPVDLFQRTMLSAARFASESGALYTFGVPPVYPATGYGYLELGARIADDGEIEHFRLTSFKEKPDPETAARYVESGAFHWNSGMFVWTADAILREIETHLPVHAGAISEAVRFDRTPGWTDALRRAFDPLEAISIDYGVMEKATDVRCVASKFSWSDVGGWPALMDYLPRDAAGNCSHGELITMDASGNLVFCEDADETVMLVGVDELVAVRAGNKTLIARKDRTEEIKQLVQSMQAR